MQTSLPDRSAGKVAWDEATGGGTRAQGTFGCDGSVCDLGFGNVSRVITRLKTNQTVHCKYAQLCMLQSQPRQDQKCERGGSCAAHTPLSSRCRSAVQGPAAAVTPQPCFPPAQVQP